MRAPLTASDRVWRHGGAGSHLPLRQSFGRLVAGALLCVATAACALPQQEPEAALPGMEPARLEAVRAAAAERPTFRPGDSLTYDSPRRTWTVAALGEEGRVAWQAENGDARITSANLILPALEWRSTEEGAGKRLISAQSEAFFPLRPGKTVRFRDTAESDRAPFAWEYLWTCRIGALEAVSVPAGTFPSHPITCTRADGAARTLHYAPELGAPVRIAERQAADQQETVRQLTAFSRAGVSMTAGEVAGDAPTGAGGPMPPTAVDGTMANPPAVPALPSAQPVEEQPLTEEASGPRRLGMIAQAEGDGLNLPAAESPVQPAPAEMPRSGLASAATQAGSSPAAVAPDAASDTASNTASGAPAAQSGSSPRAAPPGTVAVHLASYKNPDNAETGWRALLAANRDQLGEARPLVRRVDLGAKGVFYRLHAGPLDSRATAEAICRTLTQRGVYCKVATL